MEDYFIIWICSAAFSITYDVNGLVVPCNNIPLHFSECVKQLIVVENVYSEDPLCK